MNKQPHVHDDEFCLHCALDEIEPLLPHQGPIKDFIHQNTLEVFLDKPFDEAVSIASDLYHAKSYMDLGFYRDKFIKDSFHESFKNSIKKYFPDLNAKEEEQFIHALMHFIPINDEKAFEALVKKDQEQQALEAKNLAESIYGQTKTITIASVLKEKLQCSIDHHVNPILFRLLGSYIDQGVSLWPFLNQYNGFLKTVLHLAKNSKFPLASFVNNQEFVESLELELPKALKEILKNILASPALYHSYIKETLLLHPGWSGMVNVIEKHPETLARSVAINKKELLLVKLALEWQFIKHHAKDFKAICAEDLVHKKADSAGVLSLAWWLLQIKDPEFRILPFINSNTLQKVWHDAMENQYYLNVKDIISEDPKTSDVQKKFQAIFCLDDRECSFRRHLEAINSEVETFGFPGFFAIDCYFKAHKKDLLEKMCPAPVTPKHVIIEKINKGKKSDKKLLELASFISLHGANSTFFGFISAYTLGHLSLFRLMMSFFHPFKMIKAKKLSLEEKTYLQFERTENIAFDGLFHGYTHEEMADRIFTALNNIGLRNPKDMVFTIAHGSSSVNNPHFAAYDCGACSGRPGAINSRVFALMANLPKVRELVKEKGIDIPKNTVFVGGYHDTCTDEVKFFDTENLSLKHTLLLDEFVKSISSATAKNAQERCKKFALVSPRISLTNAVKEVHHRSKALFEPRPELGHASNALCIVGRREKTYLKNFDRRAFLQSYDPTNDETGKILTALLSAVIPVCGGINLEYYFSRTDPAVYGCGTKLSHNVCSLIGVGNGLDDDLRTGLPIQMTEIHDPIRLLLVIEQEPQKIIKSIKANPALIPWVANDWMKLASLDPNSQNISFLSPKAADFI